MWGHKQGTYPYDFPMGMPLREITTSPKLRKCYVSFFHNSALMFLVSLISIRRDIEKVKQKEANDESRQKLITDEDDRGEGSDVINYGAAGQDGDDVKFLD